MLAKAGGEKAMSMQSQDRDLPCASQIVIGWNNASCDVDGAMLFAPKQAPPSCFLLQVGCVFCVRGRGGRLVSFLPRKGETPEGGWIPMPRLVFLSFSLSHAGIRAESFAVGFFRSLLGERAEGRGEEKDGGLARPHRNPTVFLCESTVLLR